MYGSRRSSEGQIVTVLSHKQLADLARKVAEPAIARREGTAS